MDDLADDFAGMLLPDKRLTHRWQCTFNAIQKDPSRSLPLLLRSDAEIEGAYRLFNNDRVTFEAVHRPHAQRTAERARQAVEPVVIHDTMSTETPYADPSDVGYLNTGKAGYQTHFSFAVGVEQGRCPIPFGVLCVQTLFNARPPQQRADKKKSSKSKSGGSTVRSTTKSYLRWPRGIEASAQALGQDVRAIHVADREADSYPLFCTVIALGHGCVFRIRNDRRARLADDEIEHDLSSLSEIATRLEGKCERMVPLSKRGDKGPPSRSKTHPPRDARGARLQYSSARVELKRPHYAPADLPETLELSLVRVWEPNPPEGEVAIEWLLLTTEPAETPDEILRVVDLYRARWTIEEFHKALKTGCLLQERRFESRHALLNVLAMFLPIATRLLWLRTCAREAPDAPATIAFDPLQLTVLDQFSPRKLPPNPTVMDAYLSLAKLGGHIPNNGSPGWQVLGRAYTELAKTVAIWTASAEFHKSQVVISR